MNNVGFEVISDGLNESREFFGSGTIHWNLDKFGERDSLIVDILEQSIQSLNLSVFRG